METWPLGKTFNCVHFTEIVLSFSEYHKKSLTGFSMGGGGRGGSESFCKLGDP